MNNGSLRRNHLSGDVTLSHKPLQKSPIQQSQVSLRTIRIGKPYRKINIPSIYPWCSGIFVRAKCSVSVQSTISSPYATPYSLKAQISISPPGKYQRPARFREGVSFLETPLSLYSCVSLSSGSVLSSGMVFLTFL